MRVSRLRGPLYLLIAGFYVFMMGGATCCPGGKIGLDPGQRTANECQNLCISTCGGGSSGLSNCISKCQSSGCADCGSSGVATAVKVKPPDAAGGQPQVGKKVLVP